ncbi:nucleolar protein 58-like [Pecten maximus]|uniref:nucleolar protein 58-like n=1 Tax=Pecten maximus TaxID=6579 RepID=UPI00145862B0|nr:nucleolar protein 58-like [Pecten maximus]
MGCTYAKTTEYEQKPKRGRLRALFGRDHRRSKIQTIHIGDPVGVAVNEGTPMLNLARKTEQTVLTQLRVEGIIPKKGSGGVAFTVKINDEIQHRSASNDTSYQLPGIPQYFRDTTKPMNLKPRILPPLNTRSVIKSSPQQREMDAENLKYETLSRKGEMARLSDHRRQLAATKREAKEKDRRERLEAKIMKNSSQEIQGIDKVKVTEKIEQARLKREQTAEEKLARINAKLAKIPKQEKPNKISTEEKLERARQKREKRLEGVREKWEKKERKMEEIKKSRRLDKPQVSVPNIELS